MRGSAGECGGGGRRSAEECGGVRGSAGECGRRRLNTSDSSNDFSRYPKTIRITVQIFRVALLATSISLGNDTIIQSMFR